MAHPRKKELKSETKIAAANFITSEQKIEILEKKVAELEAENKQLLIAKTPPTRGDHEVIFEGIHYFLNFSQLFKLIDSIARGGRFMNLYAGPRGAHNALALILGLQNKEDSGTEKARQLLLKYAGK